MANATAGAGAGAWAATGAGASIATAGFGTWAVAGALGAGLGAKNCIEVGACRGLILLKYGPMDTPRKDESESIRILDVVVA